MTVTTSRGEDGETRINPRRSASRGGAESFRNRGGETMPFWVEGWIEVARLPDTAHKYAWFGVVNLGSLVDVADEDTERLFGLSKQCMTGEKSVDAFAASRGVPLNPSAQVRHELEEIAAHEAKYGPGEFGGYTHALWAEIQGIKLAEASQLRLPFALAAAMAQQFGPHRVRFVLWFNW
jgi:hypothetical protein